VSSILHVLGLSTIDILKRIILIWIIAVNDGHESPSWWAQTVLRCSTWPLLQWSKLIVTETVKFSTCEFYVKARVAHFTFYAAPCGL